MLLATLVDTSARVAATPKRSEKIALLADLLRRLTPDEIAVVTGFLTGAVRQGRIGLGWSTLRAAAPGSVAAEARLSLTDVDRAFAELADLRGAGAGSNTARTRLLGTLLAQATAPEQDFLTRLVVGELRQGALEGVLVEAIARAGSVDAGRVRRALMLTGDLGRIAALALTDDGRGLDAVRLTVFQPLQPMLADTAADVDDAGTRFTEAAADDKLDGARIQVHRAGDDVRVFSRQSNDVTVAVPEIIAAVRALPVRDVVLDGEAVALRPDGRPHPFQTTMSRFGRRLDVARLVETLPLTPVFFDCLHLDGADVLDQPTAVRWDALAERVPAGLRVLRRIVRSPADVEQALGASLDAGHEGLMVKALDAPYEAGRRGSSWLKLKPAHDLDLVILAAEWGSGRRRGWLSNLHLGAHDPEHGGFVMLGKTFKGLTDEMLRWQTERLLALEIGRDAGVVHVRPELVVEILFDGVQASSQYPGGVALRFARVRRHRPEKPAAEANTIGDVLAIFRHGRR